MKFIRKPSPPFEAFQWFKLGDGPEGVVRSYSGPDGNDVCIHCKVFLKDHGVVDTTILNLVLCPGGYVKEAAKGRWHPIYQEQFERTCVPVIDVEKWMLEGLEKLGFSGLKSEDC